MYSVWCDQYQAVVSANQLCKVVHCTVPKFQSVQYRSEGAQSGYFGEWLIYLLLLTELLLILGLHC